MSFDCYFLRFPGVVARPVRCMGIGFGQSHLQFVEPENSESPIVVHMRAAYQGGLVLR